jgi:hypothetical protein
MTTGMCSPTARFGHGIGDAVVLATQGRIR